MLENTIFSRGVCDVMIVVEISHVTIEQHAQRRKETALHFSVFFCKVLIERNFTFVFS